MHDQDPFNEDDFVGRVLIPSISLGQTISGWFPLEVNACNHLLRMLTLSSDHIEPHQEKDGSAVVGINGEVSCIKLNLDYKVY